MTAEFAKLKDRSMESILLPDIPPKCKWALDKSKCGADPHHHNPPRSIIANTIEHNTQTILITLIVFSTESPKLIIP